MGEINGISTLLSFDRTGELVWPTYGLALVGQGGAQQLALPAGAKEGARPQVQVGGSSTSLDELGPVVVNKDGTLAQIANWGQMTEDEQATTMRLIGAQNKRRLAALRVSAEETV